jgi:hypothetical protein
MVGLGPRSAIERAEIGNSRPTVVRACALLDRFKYRTVEAERRTIRLGFLLGRGRGAEAVRPSIKGYGLFPRGGGRESQSPGPCTSARPRHCSG